MPGYLKSIPLKPVEYESLMKKLETEYGPKIKISWVSKRELGFIPREFKEFRRERTEYGDSFNKYVQTIIYLDFYSEAAKTAFLMKYRWDHTKTK